ncbi:hypothetical protein [Lysinibacillus antri]|uniref:Uncharacterized protein n=1 Tax=Lysinibacillus antri TaxID=2498145 RepID=A0A3S0RGS6_9BACI|nr:hypothetical protein [Lysinibacillus antri]RUL47226.1 hypothetical protein EK386_18735 [Lysinibacillus antri]
MSNSNSLGCGTAILFFIVFAIGILILESCADDEKNEVAKPSVVVDGQDGYLIQNTFLAIDEESFDELISYYIADNGDAIIRMMENGRVFAGSKGEMVTVIDSGFTQSYIEIISTGMRGYVESELVRSKVEE